MNIFTKVLVPSVILTLMSAVPSPLLAQPAPTISMTVSDGSVTHPGPPPVSGLNTSVGTTPGGTTTMPFFTCTNRPCKVYFPSGNAAQAQPNDTFLFRDACGDRSLPACIQGNIDENSNGVARIIKFEDPSIQKLELKGLQITALKDSLPPLSPKRVTVGFRTDNGGFDSVPAGDYPWAAVLSGSFTKRPQQHILGPGGLTNSCGSDPNAPCARLQLWINGQDPDDFSNRPAHVRTVSIPCNNASSISPCGPGGSYPGTGSFLSYLEGSTQFDQSTVPDQTVELKEVSFTRKDQTFAPVSSAIIAMSKRKDVDYGVEALFYSLAEDIGADRWVYFTASSDTYLPRKDGVHLTSIATSEEKKLSAAEQARNDRSYASYIATPAALRWKEVGTLQLVYDFLEGRSFSGYRELRALTFSDCINGAFRLRVALVDEKQKPVPELYVYLGNSSSDGYKSGCVAAVKRLNNANLVADKELRSEQRVNGVMSIEQSQITFGDYYVRSISVVLDQGDATRKANYKVNLRDVTVR